VLVLPLFVERVDFRADRIAGAFRYESDSGRRITSYYGKVTSRGIPQIDGRLERTATICLLTRLALPIWLSGQ
jgi:hypothetical protein